MYAPDVCLQCVLVLKAEFYNSIFIQETAMKSTFTTLLPAGLLLIVAGFLVAGFLVAGATAQPPVQRTARWEHLALTQEDAGLGGGLSRQIIRLGNEGWELVDVTPIAKDGTTVKTRYYFKRPK